MWISEESQLVGIYCYFQRGKQNKNFIAFMKNRCLYYELWVNAAEWCGAGVNYVISERDKIRLCSFVHFQHIQGDIRRAQQKCREKTGSRRPSRCVEKWLSSRFNEPSTLYLFLNILTLALSDHYQPWIFGFIDHLKDNEIILFESVTTSTNRG